MKIRLALLLCMLCCCMAGYSQDTTKVVPAPKQYVIETTDGTTITGTIVSEDDQQVVLKTGSLGEVTIQRSKIRSMKEIDAGAFKKGSYWFENPAATRYVIGPSAFTLRKNEGYYQNLYLFAHSVNYGITDHITIGAGTEIASVIFGQQAPQVFFFTPKIGYRLAPKLHAGAGVLYAVERIGFYSADGGSNNHHGILYGLVTAGTRDNNFTLGIGWGAHNSRRRDYTTNQYYWDSEISSRPILTFSGMWRPAKRFALTTENWVYPVKNVHYTFNPYPAPPTTTYSYSYEFFVSYGARFIGERIAVDFGFINNPDIAEYLFVGVPYIDFVVKFDCKKWGKKNKPAPSESK